MDLYVLADPSLRAGQLLEVVRLMLANLLPHPIHYLGETKMYKLMKVLQYMHAKK